MRDCITPGTGNCIDYEKKHRYDMTVTARDDDGLGQAVTINLIVNILDVNDNAPAFSTNGEHTILVILQPFVICKTYLFSAIF